MKSSQEILGLPVLSIEEGKQIGIVKDLVLNPERGTLDFVLVEDGKWYFGLNSIPFKEVQGIGEYALTVEGRSSLSVITECAEAVDLLRKNLRLPGLKVLSKKGRLVGSVSEYFIDENTGEIMGCQLIPVGSGETSGIIHRKSILTYGSDYLIVEEGVEEKLVTEIQVQNIAMNELKVDSPKTDLSTGITPQVPIEEKEPGETLKYFEEQQRQYLLGKIVTMQIIDDNGQVVVEEGETITEETIKRAIAANMYTQLTLNIRD